MKPKNVTEPELQALITPFATANAMITAVNGKDLGGREPKLTEARARKRPMQARAVPPRIQPKEADAMTAARSIEDRPVKNKIAVSEANLRKAAARLLGAKLVSTEVVYIQRELGSSATREELDAKVVAVRAMPWSSIVVPD